MGLSVKEFEEQRGVLQCKYEDCRSTNLDTRQKLQHVELFCTACGRYQQYLAQGNTPAKRPKLERGTTDQVWAAAYGYCAHCGIHQDFLAILAVERTVQHVPPFIVNGHEGYLIPLCGWCQQSSAAQMKRLTSLVARLTEHFKMDK